MKKILVNSVAKMEVLDCKSTGEVKEKMPNTKKMSCMSDLFDAGYHACRCEKVRKGTHSFEAGVPVPYRGKDGKDGYVINFGSKSTFAGNPSKTFDALCYFFK